MNWIFPMAGNGSRTKALGGFKQLINIAGKTMLEWFLLGIESNIAPDDELIFIVLEEHFDAVLDKLPLCSFMPTVEAVQAGPAKTIQAGLNDLSDRIDLTKPAIVVNSDQFIKFTVPPIDKEGGFAAVYYNDSAKSSYAKN